MVKTPVQGAWVRSLVKARDPTCRTIKRDHIPHLEEKEKKISCATMKMEDPMCHNQVLA